MSGRIDSVVRMHIRFGFFIFCSHFNGIPAPVQFECGSCDALNTVLLLFNGIRWVFTAAVCFFLFNSVDLHNVQDKTPASTHISNSCAHIRMESPRINGRKHTEKPSNSQQCNVLLLTN